MLKPPATGERRCFAERGGGAGGLLDVGDLACPWGEGRLGAGVKERRNDCSGPCEEKPGERAGGCSTAVSCHLPSPGGCEGWQPRSRAARSVPGAAARPAPRPVAVQRCCHAAVTCSGAGCVVAVTRMIPCLCAGAGCDARCPFRCQGRREPDVGARLLLQRSSSPFPLWSWFSLVPRGLRLCVSGTWRVWGQQILR